MPMFREHCSSLHQGKKQPDTKLLLWKILYVYSLFSEKGKEGKGQDVGKGREGGKSRWNCDSSDYFLWLISQSIFDNRENGLPYFTYIVAVISV